MKPPWRAGRRASFFAIMSLVVAAIVAAGFGPSYARNLAPPGLPFWVHLHGAVMTAWILLFAGQAALVRRRALPLHRTLGLASIVLVVVMVTLGLATNLLAIRRGATPPFFTPEQMLAADVCDMLLFGLSLALRHRREWHKRLLLCATVLLAWPAIGRLPPLRHFGMAMVVPLSFALLLMLACAGPLHDLATRRRIHPAYLWGVGIIAAAQPLHSVVAASAPAHAIVTRMLAPDQATSRASAPAPASR